MTDKTATKRGRPVGTGGKYVMNPNKIRTRRSGLKYNKAPKRLTDEEIQNKITKQKLYSKNSYEKMKIKKNKLKNDADEIEALKRRIILMIVVNLDCLTKDELTEYINRLIEERETNGQIL